MQKLIIALLLILSVNLIDSKVLAETQNSTASISFIENTHKEPDVFISIIAGESFIINNTNIDLQIKEYLKNWENTINLKKQLKTKFPLTKTSKYLITVLDTPNNSNSENLLEFSN